jgi:putative ABC transport system permease protein
MLIPGCAEVAKDVSFSAMLSLLIRSWRSWARAKSIAGLAILALAIGIGCATAVFTVVNSVLLNPLPYRDSGRWVALFGGSTLEPTRYSALTLAEVKEYQQRTHSFDVFGWYKISGDFNLNSAGVVEHIAGAEVTPSLLAGAGVQPLAGRLFRDADGAQVAMISSRLWRRLGSDRSIEGKPIALDGKAYTVVGVLPAWFQLPIVSVGNENLHNDVWIPVDANEAAARQNSGIYAVYARMKPGMTVAAARADAKSVADAIARENHRPATYTATLFGLQDFVVKDVRPFLFLLMGAAGVLLLITCANVGGLLVARSVQRTQEIAVRVALGAQKRQLILQFLAEGLFISLVAAVLGVLASVGLTRLFVGLAAAYIPRSAEVSISPMVLLFAVGLVFLTALLPALAPLRQAARTQPTEVLTSGVRASAGFRSRRISNLLVIAEIAFAFLLLSSGGLLVAELYALQHAWPGFDASHLVTFQIDAPDGQFSSSDELLRYQRALLTALQSIPGVKGAALSNQLPMNCCMTTSIFMEGDSANEGHEVSFVIASPGYAETLGISLKQGRWLNEHDDNGDVAGVAINAAAADGYWRGRDPIGAFGRVSSPTGDRFRVVGVVGNVSNDGRGKATRPEIYLLDALAPVRQMKLIVRSALPLSSLLPALRHATEGVGPHLPVYAVSTMTQLGDDSTSLEHFASVVVMFFAVSALALACLGIYSMTAFSLGERRVEFGTRLALGAAPRDLMRLIIGDSARLAMYGVLAGIPAAAGATWIIVHFMQLHRPGGLPYAGSLVVVSCLATAACFPPAWRATFLSPMVAIRQEPEDFWTSGRRGMQAIAQVIKPARSTDTAPNVFAGLVEATRRADSTTQLLAGVLQALRTQFGSDWAMIFERTSAPAAGFACLAMDPEHLVCATIPANGFLLGRLKFQTLLTFGGDEFDTVLRWAADQQNPRTAEVEYLKQLGTRAALALWAKNEITGLLLFGKPAGREQYSSAEKELMKTCGQQLALMVENAKLTDRLVEQEKVRRDVALAAEVQKRFLPQNSVQNEESSAAAYFQPARVVSGDCYDFLDLGEETIGFTLADVAGKGVAAALVTAAVQSAIRIFASEQTVSPSEMARKLNAFLYRHTGPSTYATFFFASIRGRQLRYVNAGHNPPWLFRSAGQQTARYERIRELTVGGMFVGMFPEPHYEEGLITLERGDVVLAFTDGVTEALNPDDEEFGEERLQELGCRFGALPVDEMAARVAAEVREWIGHAPQHDDLTLIVIKTV